MPNGDNFIDDFCTGNATIDLCHERDNSYSPLDRLEIEVVLSPSSGFNCMLKNMHIHIVFYLSHQRVNA